MSEKVSQKTLEKKAKTLKVGVVPWQLWIKSPAYLKLSPEKKIKSLLTIIKRKEEEIAKLKEAFCSLTNILNDVATNYTNLKNRVGQIREWYEKRPREINVDDLNPFWDWLKSGKKLVELLGQNSEKLEPKKEEKR